MNAPLPAIAEILAAAAERGAVKSLAYAGEVTPREAHRLFSDAGAKIVDVRFPFEYEYIGRVPESTLIPWRLTPGGALNADFLSTLTEQCAHDELVLFLCRSGVRSHAAAEAAAKAGYRQAFNILDGFEGDLDSRQQRGREAGWQSADLPWVQS